MHTTRYPSCLYAFILLDAAAKSAARQGAVGSADYKTGVTIGEACQILNVDLDEPIENIAKVGCLSIVVAHIRF